MPLSRYSVGTYQPIRKRAHTQLVREHSVTVVSLWTDPGLKSGISVRKLISTYKKKKKKKRRQGMNFRTFSQNPRRRGKSPHTMWNRYRKTTSSYNKTSSGLLSGRRAGTWPFTQRSAPLCHSVCHQSQEGPAVLLQAPWPHT